MIQIPLANGKGFALINDEDFALVEPYIWRLSQHKRINKDGSVGLGPKYARGYLKGEGRSGRSVLMHRLLAGILDRPDVYVDHIDGDGLNNRRDNLRLCTRSENLANQSSARGTSQFKGVFWNSKDAKWQAAIRKNGAQYYLGLFDSEIDAALAYDRKARVLFKEFARLNFPKPGERGNIHERSNSTPPFENR